jgi:hypothetical protein
MDEFLDAMIELAATHRDVDVLSSKEVRSLVDRALDRECEDDEFAELCNVLELNAQAKRFPLSSLKASIHAARARCDEWEGGDGEEDAGGGDEADGGFLEAVAGRSGGGGGSGGGRGSRGASEARSAAPSEEGYDVGGDESEAESVCESGDRHATTAPRPSSSDHFLASEFASPGGPGPRTRVATGDSPAAVLASALGLAGLQSPEPAYDPSLGDALADDASGRSSPR